MISRRKEPEGKPFLRVPLKKNPAPPKKAKKEREDNGSDALLKGAVERGNREQAREARDLEMLNRGKKPMAKGGKVMKHATKAGKAMTKKSADTMGRAMVKKAMGGKMYAKGGSVDGCATKGKTKGKMVKMAMGGAMGRAMRPNMMSQVRGGPERARLPMMAKGGKAKGKSC
jgi:hypothetical protein